MGAGATAWAAAWIGAGMVTSCSTGIGFAAGTCEPEAGASVGAMPSGAGIWNWTAA